MDEARRKGHEHIVVFFEVFFAIPDVSNSDNSLLSIIDVISDLTCNITCLSHAGWY